MKKLFTLSLLAIATTSQAYFEFAYTNPLEFQKGEDQHVWVTAYGQWLGGDAVVDLSSLRITRPYWMWPESQAEVEILFPNVDTSSNTALLTVNPTPVPIARWRTAEGVEAPENPYVWTNRLRWNFNYRWVRDTTSPTAFPEWNEGDAYIRTVPEPGTFAVIGLGAVALLRRRKRA